MNDYCSGCCSDTLLFNIARTKASETRRDSAIFLGNRWNFSVETYAVVSWGQYAQPGAKFASLSNSRWATSTWDYHNIRNWEQMNDHCWACACMMNKQWRLGKKWITTFPPIRWFIWWWGRASALMIADLEMVSCTTGGRTIVMLQNLHVRRG